MTKLVVPSLDGTNTLLEWDTDGVTVTHQQDMGQVQKNLTQFRHASENYGKRNIRHAASIPMAVWHLWRHEFSQNYSSDMDWQTYLKRKINDSEYSKMRNQKL